MTRSLSAVVVLAAALLSACDAPAGPDMSLSDGSYAFARPDGVGGGPPDGVGGGPPAGVGGPAGGTDACRDSWETLTKADGTPFSSLAECMQYSGQGGTPVSLPVITSFSVTGFLPMDENGNIAPLFTAVFSGGTATITFEPYNRTVSVTSGVPAIVYECSLPGNYTLRVTNSSGSVTSTIAPFGDFPFGGGATPGCNSGA